MPNRMECPVALVAVLCLASCGSERLSPAEERYPSVPQVEDNEPPVAVAGLHPSWADAAILPGDAVVLDGSASHDPEGQPLVYAWRVAAHPPGSATTPTPADHVSPQLLLDVEGAYLVELTVTDPGGLSDTANITLSADAVYVDAPFDVEVVDFWVSSSSCYYVSPVLSGSLTVDRNDPSIVFHFDSSTFVGTIDANNNFTVELEQEFDFTDGCHWQALDRLVGQFTSADAFEADHTYTEWPTSGSYCASACDITSHLIGTRSVP